MTGNPTLDDFEQVLRRRSAKALDQLGRASAAITAEAARNGALSNNRIVFRYTDALEEHWNALASDDMDDLRRWYRTTRIDRTALRDAVERELRALIPQMIAASRAERSRDQFANKVMLASAIDRVNGIGADLDFRLRQFDINMDDPTAEPKIHWARRGLRSVGNHVPEIIVGLILLLIGAAFGLS